MSDYCNYDYAVKAAVNLFEDSVEIATKKYTEKVNEKIGAEMSKLYAENLNAIRQENDKRVKELETERDKARYDKKDAEKTVNYRKQQINKLTDDIEKIKGSRSKVSTVITLLTEIQ